MSRRCQTVVLSLCASLSIFITRADAQQSDGVLKFFHRDSPASASIHEEATISSVAPFRASSTISFYSSRTKSKTGLI